MLRLFFSLLMLTHLNANTNSAKATIINSPEENYTFQLIYNDDNKLISFKVIDTNGVSECSLKYTGNKHILLTEIYTNAINKERTESTREYTFNEYDKVTNIKINNADGDKISINYHYNKKHELIKKTSSDKYFNVHYKNNADGRIIKEILDDKSETSYIIYIKEKIKSLASFDRKGNPIEYITFNKPITRKTFVLLLE